MLLTHLLEPGDGFAAPKGMASGCRNGALYHNRDVAERLTLISVSSQPGLLCTLRVDTPGKARAKTVRVVSRVTVETKNREKKWVCHPGTWWLVERRKRSRKPIFVPSRA